MSLKYLGWRRFTNTGGPYRAWEFEEDVPELEAKKGWALIDYGPHVKESRFQVRSGKDSVWWDANDVYEWDPLLKHLRWNPPREGEERIVKAIDGVATQLRDLLAAARSAGSEGLADKKLRVIERILGNNGKKPETNTTENHYLRLQFDGEYDNGDPYKDYVFLVDVPEIPATRTRVVEGPRHAIKGDLLRVIDDGDRFSLRRGNKRIGSPEWWQLREISVGLSLRGEAKEEDRAEPEPEQDPVLRALRQIIPDGPRRLGKGGVLFYTAFYATASIPGTQVKKGSFLIHAPHGPLSKPERAAIRGIFTRIPRGQFPTIAEHLDYLEEVESSCEAGASGQLRKYLGNHTALRGADATSPILIVRPIRSPVGEPIDASSDESALFELIYSTGGRMPEEAS